jgi:1-acyl-sn-glycerol-3-phosphate acyltransferase
MQENLIVILRLLVAYSLIGASGSVALLLRVLSFGTSTDFCRRYIVGGSSRLILRLIGIRLELPPRSAFPTGQVMYTFNHNSFLDVLLVTGLGLQNTRFFLSEGTLKFIPVTISAIAIGTLYIPLQKHEARRERFFEKTTQRIMREGCSVFVSSEGVHRFVHGIAPFNHGVYRMAMEAGLPVVPVYFHIPEKVNSLEGFKYRSGAVRIELLPAIQTSEWCQGELAEHVASVREIFFRKFNEANGISVR